MSLNKKSVDDINVKGLRVLCRCDFNVPLKEGQITDENRLVAALPTIKKLIADGGKVILCSHLGKVKTEEDKQTKTLAPVAKRLSELLGQEVKFAADPEVVGPNAKAAVEAMKDGDVILLENTRFRAEETKNGEAFSKDLASICDVFVNDAFGTAHRAHCSNVGVASLVDTAVVGYLMQKEIDFLGNAVENPVRPFVAILGGAKVADKLNVISNLLEKCDTLIIGGGMAYTFLKAKGYEIGKSLVDETKIDYCKEMMEKAEKLGKKLYITGKGRCNLTNDCDPKELQDKIVTNKRFLYSCMSAFGPSSVIEMFEAKGLRLKTERGNRVFPESDKSSDVIKTLEKSIRTNGVRVMLESEVKDIVIRDKAFKSIIIDGREEIAADACFVATGGLSYPSTGSTGRSPYHQTRYDT